MADRQFQIQISSTFDPSGTKQAAIGFQKLGEDGKESGESIFESHHEVHKLIHTMGNVTIPGMGQAFAALQHGPLGALIAVGLAVEFIKKNIEDTTKRLDEMSASAGKAFGGGDSLTDYVKATAEAAAQADALAAALKKASDGGSEVTNRYTAEAKAIHEVVEALKAKLKAEGKPVPDELLSNAEAQAQQHERDRELAERQKNQPGLESAAESTLTPERVLRTRAERASELAAQEAALAKATGELNTQANDDLNEKIENLKGGLENMKRDGSRAFLIKNREAEIALLESETAENRKANAEDRIKQLSKEVAKDTENANKEKSARDEATKAATDNAARIVQLQKDIADANTAAKIKAESSPQLVRGLQPYVDPKTFEGLAGVDSESGAAGFVQQFLAAQSRLSQHKGTAQDSETIRLMNQLLQASSQSDQSMYKILQALIQRHGQTSDQISRLWSELEKQDDRISSAARVRH